MEFKETTIAEISRKVQKTSKFGIWGSLGFTLSYPDLVHACYSPWALRNMVLLRGNRPLFGVDMEV